MRRWAVIVFVLMAEDQVTRYGGGLPPASAVRAPTATPAVPGTGRPGARRGGKRRAQRGQPARRRQRTARASWAAGLTAAVVLLFLAYLRQSQQVPVRSDGGSIALQAWDMLHGNPLLHGWTMSDVSFWSTELVQYTLLEAVHGLGPGVIHLGGAMTYTLLVVLAAWLARGRATGREGVARAGLAVVIMLAPAPAASRTLLFTPDHLGSAVPVLLAWLAAERLLARRSRVTPAAGCLPARRGRVTPAAARLPARRGRVTPAAGVAGAAGVALLLAWGQVADGLILLTGAAPMAIACGARAAVTWRHRARGASPAPDLLLVAAAVASAGLARAAEAVIRVSGGFVLKPVATQFAGLPALPQHVKLTAEGLLVLFGAGLPVPHSGAGLALTALHLALAAAAAVAFLVAVSRLGRGAEPATGALALAIVFNIAAYVPTDYVQNLLSAREISAVLPFGAVLAGRVLGGPAVRARLAPVLAAAAVACAVTLGYHATRPPAPAANQPLASWLAARHLTAGLSADYWVANSTTLDAGGRITVRQISLSHGTLVRPLSWGFQAGWYDPAAHQAVFLVGTDTTRRDWQGAAARAFGPPAQVLRPPGYTVLVWHKNLLGDIR